MRVVFRVLYHLLEESSKPYIGFLRFQMIPAFEISLGGFIQMSLLVGSARRKAAVTSILSIIFHE
jgi:hypothetical protein